MTYLRTCKNCKFEKSDCELRNDLRMQIKGMGITSIKFKCDGREPLFAVGQRVAVTWPVSCGDYYEGYETNLETWPATVVAERGARFLICVDDVESDLETPMSEYLKSGPYAKVPSLRLASIDGPARPVCPVCCNVGPDFKVCYAQPGYKPLGCALQSEQVELSKL